MRVYTTQEISRHAIYNKILVAFKEQKNVHETMQEVGTSSGYLLIHCKWLESKGYLFMEIKRTSDFFKKTFFFKTLIDTFEIEDLEERLNKAGNLHNKIKIVTKIQGARVIKGRHPSRLPAPKSRTWAGTSMGYSTW